MTTHGIHSSNAAQTFCGKPWRHRASGSRYKAVVPGRGMQIDCFNCQLNLFVGALKEATAKIHHEFCSESMHVDACERFTALIRSQPGSRVDWRVEDEDF